MSNPSFDYEDLSEYFGFSEISLPEPTGPPPPLTPKDILRMKADRDQFLRHLEMAKEARRQEQQQPQSNAKADSSDSAPMNGS